VLWQERFVERLVLSLEMVKTEEVNHRHLWPVSIRVRSILQSGQFRAILAALVNVRLWDLRSFRTVFIHVIRGRPTPGGLLQFSANRERCCSWMIEVRTKKRLSIFVWVLCCVFVVNAVSYIERMFL